MAGEGRVSHLIVISLGDVCIHLYLLQQEARSGYAPASYYYLLSLFFTTIIIIIINTFAIKNKFMPI